MASNLDPDFAVAILGRTLSDHGFVVLFVDKDRWPKDGEGITDEGERTLVRISFPRLHASDAARFAAHYAEAHKNGGLYPPVEIESVDPAGERYSRPFFSPLPEGHANTAVRIWGLENVAKFMQNYWEIIPDEQRGIINTVSRTLDDDVYRLMQKEAAPPRGFVKQ